MPQDPRDATGLRILDAAAELIVERGIQGASMEGIAKHAGLSHMTVYRRWPRKSLLLTTLLEREAERLYQRVDIELADVDEPDERLLRGFVVVFSYFYEHPVLKAELARGSVDVLAAFTTASTPVVEQAVDYLAMRLELTDDALSRAMAEVLVRFCHSLFLSSVTIRPFDDQRQVRDYGERVLLPLMRSLM